jgi:hypothetical protein
MRKLQILMPYNPAEAISTAEAARQAGVAERTIRDWNDVGRKVGGRRQLSQIALDMKLVGDTGAIDDYHQGDRTSPRVVDYYKSRGIPLPGAIFDTILDTGATVSAASADFAAVD